MCSSVLDVLKLDWSPRAREGPGPSDVLVRHVLPNALIRHHALRLHRSAAPVLGRVVAETVFVWRVFGSLTLEAIQRRPVPVLGAVLGERCSWPATPWRTSVRVRRSAGAVMTDGAMGKAAAGCRPGRGWRRWCSEPRAAPVGRQAGRFYAIAALARCPRAPTTRARHGPAALLPSADACARRGMVDNHARRPRANVRRLRPARAPVALVKGAPWKFPSVLPSDRHQPGGRARARSPVLAPTRWATCVLAPA